MQEGSWKKHHLELERLLFSMIDWDPEREFGVY
jgi:hypothetical protein